MSPYMTYSDVYHHGNHLEHIHAYYYSSDTTTTNEPIPTIDMHTDNGLMIAMTTGYYNNNEHVNEKSGLYIELSSGFILLHTHSYLLTYLYLLLLGSIVQVKPSDDSLIIMIGEGGSSWYQPIFGKPFRAVPHALYIQDNDISTTRSWYSSSSYITIILYFFLTFTCTKLGMV